MLVPDYIKINVPVKNEETGLTESKESYRISYYQGNMPTACKTCLVKKNSDLEYVMKLRRNGSAYCEECARDYKLNNK